MQFLNYYSIKRETVTEIMPLNPHAKKMRCQVHVPVVTVLSFHWDNSSIGSILLCNAVRGILKICGQDPETVCARESRSTGCEICANLPSSVIDTKATYCVRVLIWKTFVSRQKPYSTTQHRFLVRLYRVGFFNEVVLLGSGWILGKINPTGSVCNVQSMSYLRW